MIEASGWPAERDAHAAIFLIYAALRRGALVFLAALLDFGLVGSGRRNGYQTETEAAFP